MNSFRDTTSTDRGSNTSPLDELSDDALMRTAQVKPLFGNPSDSTLWRWIKAGDFPPPVEKTGPKGRGPRLWTVRSIRDRLRAHK